MITTCQQQQDGVVRECDRTPSPSHHPIILPVTLSEAGYVTTPEESGAASPVAELQYHYRRTHRAESQRLPDRLRPSI